MAVVKKFGKLKVVIQSLTFGYLYDIENDIIVESPLGLMLDATNLSEDDIRTLTRIETSEIVDLITKETYPELYDEDGKQIEQDLSEFNDDKKKV